MRGPKRNIPQESTRKIMRRNENVEEQVNNATNYIERMV